MGIFSCKTLKGGKISKCISISPHHQKANKSFLSNDSVEGSNLKWKVDDSDFVPFFWNYHENEYPLWNLVIFKNRHYNSLSSSTLWTLMMSAVRSGGTHAGLTRDNIPSRAARKTISSFIKVGLESEWWGFCN